MVALKHTWWLLGILLALSLSGARVIAAPEASLFAQSAAGVLKRDFTDPDLSFLLLDARTGKIMASRWNDPEARIPMGSLVKPFTALAYGEQHEFRYPAHVCRGTASGCWRPRGHGQVDLTTAVAYSCNSYFEALSAQLSAQEVSSTATRFGIEPPQSLATGAGLVGIGRQWLISPARMSRAYLELVRRREQPGVRKIVDGMLLSGRQGTGAAVDHALRYGEALVKTGTAPCTHEQRAPGDGFAVALWPADAPRVLLLVQVHGVPGAQAAKTAGEILSRIGE
jgi:cell division protein FtsI/penicillin-binding protein 2